MTAEFTGFRTVPLCASIIVLILYSTAFGQVIREEARRHMARGEAAIELAKTPADYEKAAREFNEAIRLSPEWADPYYNLGLIQEKLEKYEEAIASLGQYLRLAPGAADAESVRSHLYKLEFRLEEKLSIAAKYAPVIGVWREQWVGPGIYNMANGEWTVSLQGDKVILGAGLEGTFDGTTLTFHYPPGTLPGGIYKQLRLTASNRMRGIYQATSAMDAANSNGRLLQWVPIEWTRKSP